MRGFHELQQTTETVAEITAKFREQMLLIPQYATDEVMLRRRHHSMLREDIHESVSSTGCKILNETMENTDERVMELDFCTKRKPK